MSAIGVLAAAVEADQLWPLLLATAMLGWLVGVALARPAWITAAALGLFLFEAVFGSPPGLDLGGTLLYPRDGVFLAMAVAAACRMVREGSRHALAGWAWWTLVLLVSLSLWRGVVAFGPSVAGNDFRPAFYLVAAVSFFATQRSGGPWVRDVVDLWIGTALLLVAVGILRTIGVRVGAAVEDQLFLGGRALYAWSTLLIGQAALLAFFAEPLGSRWARVRSLPYLFLSGVLIFQHRTVWLTMAAALIAMATVWKPDHGPSGSPPVRWLAGLAVGTGVLALVVVGGKAGGLGNDLLRSAQTTTGKESTFVWRVEGWQDLLGAQRARPSDLLAGRPYGSGYNRRVFGTDVNYSPHSWYVQTLARAGVAGLAVLLVLLFRLLRRGIPGGPLPRNLGALLVLSAAVYGIAYHPPETQGVLLGLVVFASRARSGAGPDAEATLAAGQPGVRP